MGHGSYSIGSSMARSTRMYSKASRDEIFTARTIDNKMHPKGTLRECRNSEDHPDTLPIIVALDVTGSMGYVPEKFIKEDMTKLMASLYSSGLMDSQVLFMGIGDHECDSYPLQVGQFEADDQLMDKWLKSIYLESGGGGNGGESYLLAWYYAARHTSIDSVEKNGKKGFLFTIGDEPNLKSFPASYQKGIFGENGVYADISDAEILAEARKNYNVFHILLQETSSGKSIKTLSYWKEVMGDDLIIVQTSGEIAGKIAETIKKYSHGEKVVKLKEVTEKVEESAEVML